MAAMVNNPPALPTRLSANAAVLLVLAPFEESAKRVESHLRNAGHKARCVWLSQNADLEAQLQRQPPDLLLVSEHSPAITLKAALEACRRFAPTVPLLALGSQLDGARIAAAVAAGARDLVAESDAESLAHLERVYRRELHAHRQLRELAHTKALLADYEARYAQLMAGSGDGVAHIHEGILTQVNPAFATLLGHDDPAPLLGLPLMDLIAPAHLSAARDHLRQLHNGRADGKPFECALRSRQGEPVPICATLTRGEAEGERFVEMLIRAPATPLPVPVVASGTSGRLDFAKALETPAADSRPRAALLVVADKAAALEERIGPLDFEEVMGQVAAQLAAPLAEGDSLYRFSTQEFALLVSRPDAAQFERLATQLAQQVAGQVFSTREHESQLTVSLAVYPLGAGDAPAPVLRELAREARRVSAAGGNTHVVLGPTAKAHTEERELAQRAQALRDAIEHNRLKLAYQTIASLEGESREHFDVFVRMVNEEGVELHASDFIRVAESAGLMGTIDRWVTTRVWKILAGREAQSAGSILFVKLSEQTLREADEFLAWYRDLLKGRRLAAQELCFEIPELVLQNHVRKARTLTRGLQELGAGLAIEHFGIGSNSEQLIEQMPATFLKFHMSFTQNFERSEMQDKMARLIAAARRRQIHTIASHVEDANTMARMWQLGVQYVQGYHVQPPEVVLIT